MSNDNQSESRAQGREEAEPSEQGKPIPRIFLMFALALVLWGAGYILFSGSFGRPELGDRRTVADLSGPAPGAQAGGAVNGGQLFTNHCVACHQATGKGLPGVFPPLDGSEWVNGDERIVANILLHGITGEITVMGNTFKGAMPAFNQLSDAELAAVASHVRSQWSNKSAAIKPELFQSERASSKRTAPFNGGEDLKTLATKVP